MSNFQRGRQDDRNFHGRTGRSPSSQYNMNQKNRVVTPNRMNPWEPGINPGMGSNMGNIMGHNMGHNMGNNMGNFNNSGNNMGNFNNSGNNMSNFNNMNNFNNMGNLNMSGNRPVGGLLPTPNMSGPGLLQPTSMQMQDVQLPYGNVMNMPNLQSSPQQNQMAPLLPLTNRGGLLPLNHPGGPLQNPNFGGQRPPGRGPIRPQMAGRRPEPYNKTGNRNQRSGQTNDRKSANSSPRAAASPKNNTQQTKVKDDESSKSNDKSKEDKGKIVNKDADIDKALDAYSDIPSELFKCHICTTEMGDSEEFSKHIKGKAHQTKIDQREKSYEKQAETMRHEMKVAEQQRVIAFQKKKGPKGTLPPREQCSMCRLQFNGYLGAHRKSSPHQSLKAFLHPNCEDCSLEFPTRIEWDQHLLSAGHLKTAAAKLPKEEKNLKLDSSNKHCKQINEEKSRNSVTAVAAKESGVQQDKVKVPLLATPVQSDKVKAPLLASTPKTVSSVLEQSKVPEYDASKEIGMDMLKEKTGYLCQCCNRFLSCSADAKTHCRSQFHYEKYVSFLRSKANQLVQSQNKNSSETANAENLKNTEEEETTQKVLEPEDDEEDEEDEGNWKRRKIAKEENLANDTLIQNIEEKKPDEQGTSPLKDVDNDKSVVENKEDTPNSLVKSSVAPNPSDDLEKTLLIDQDSATPDQDMVQKEQ